MSADDLEAWIVAGILQQPAAAIRYPIDPRWFTLPSHRALVIAAQSLAIHEGGGDLPAVIQAAQRELPELRASDVYDLCEHEPVNLGGLVQRLRVRWEQRELARVVRAWLDSGWSEQAAAGQLVGTLWDDLGGLLGAAGDDYVRVYDVTLRQRAAAALAGEIDPETVRTGLQDLDDVTGGFPRGAASVIGGRPGRGKSALLQQIAEAAGHRGEIVLLASPEMSAWEVADRGIAREAQIDLMDLRQRTLTSGERERLEAVRGAPGVTLYDHPRQTSGNIGQVARQVAMVHGKLDLICVDYVQFLADKPRRGESRYEVVGRALRNLKAVARSLGAAVVAGAQLKRTEHPRPQLSDLRESGDLEQDAHQVLLLCEPEAQAFGLPEVPILVAKNRQGQAGGTVTLLWDAPRTRFLCRGE